MDSNHNLFQVEWTEGNLGSIKFIVEILSTVACWLISIVGFGIVIFSIMKNALAGLYAVSPKLWDRVDEIKKANISARTSEGGNQLINILGSIPTMLCKLLPNIKAMTEFEDEQISPKVYFMKSIPVLCVQIFIGAFIFFGYPAQIANKVTEFGTGVIDVVFANVDPKAWIESLPGELTSYPFVTKDSQVEYDQNILKIAKEGTSTIAGTFDDMTKESRINAALTFEQWAIQHYAGIGEYMTDTEGWTLTVSTSYSTMDMSANISRINGNSLSSDGNTYVHAAQCPVASLNTGSAKVTAGSEGYIYVVTTFSKNAVDTTNSERSQIKDATLHLDVNKATNVGNGVQIDIDTSMLTLTGSTWDLNVGGTTTQVQLSISGGKVLVSGATGINGGILTPGPASTLKYFDGENTTKIVSISVDSTGSTYLTSDNGTQWNFGEKIPTSSSTSGSGNSVTETGGTAVEPSEPTVGF